MDLNKTLEKINSDRYKAECGFVFSLWKDPELYLDYMNLNEGKDETLKNKDAVFYYNLGKAMYKAGFRNLDALSVDTFLTKKDSARKRFEEMGGYASVEELKSLVNDVNAEAYFDIIAKKNTLSLIANTYENLFNDVNRFESATCEDVYNAFDLLNNGVAVANHIDAKVEQLQITDKFLEDCDKGTARGLDYGSACPILNYITLGIPRGNLTMLAGMSGTGKSSFTFENVVIPLNQRGIKVAIISNEMTIDIYQQLLLVHVLTKELKQFGITRKKLKMGNFTDEQKELLAEAQKIADEKYAGIVFIKMFENESMKVLKHIRKLANQGFEVVFYDTFKASDTTKDEQMWVSLLQDSRRLFNVASKYNIAVITTYQLGISTASKTRYLDASTLSNSKQIIEVYSEVILMRPLWRSEYSGQKYDCKPYTLKKDENGKWIKDMDIQLDDSKTYLVLFINKTRNDANEQQILYSFDGRYNRWVEIGRCSIHSDVKG